MKVAVIINEGSCGGWRWVCDVFGGIKKYYPDADITVFYQKNAACPSDILQVMEQSGLKVNTGYHLPNKPFNKKKYSRIKLVNNVINGIRKKIKK